MPSTLVQPSGLPKAYSQGRTVHPSDSCCRGQGQASGGRCHPPCSCPLPEDPAGSCREGGTPPAPRVCRKVRHAQQETGAQGGRARHLCGGRQRVHGPQPHVQRQGECGVGNSTTSWGGGPAGAARPAPQGAPLMLFVVDALFINLLLSPACLLQRCAVCCSPRLSAVDSQVGSGDSFVKTCAARCWFVSLGPL